MQQTVISTSGKALRKRKAIIWAAALNLPSMTTDALIHAADSALRTLFATPRSARPTPLARAHDGAAPLSEAEKHLSGALMRVNHAGMGHFVALHLLHDGA